MENIERYLSNIAFLKAVDSMDVFKLAEIKTEIESLRMELMGFAIILIMLFHLGVLPFGECGVDIFLFLSGFSMYHSLSRNDNMLKFYRKRLLRILPAYLIIAIPYFVLKTCTIEDFLLKITNLCIVFQGEMGGWWFITIILLCYLLAPLMYRVLRKMDMGGQFFLYCLLLLVCIIVGENIENIRIFMVRIPAFFLGMCLGFDRFTTHKGFVSLEIFAAVVLTICFGFLLFKNHDFWVYRKSYYTIIVYPLVLSVIFMINFLPVVEKRLLAYLGSITLELYMVHESLMVPLAKYICEFLGEGWLFASSYRCLSVILSIPAALILHQILNKIMSLINDR